MSRELEIPELALVVLIGAAGSGTGKLARRLFDDAEILSLDYFSRRVPEHDAAECLQFVLARRLAAGRFTVVDAPNTQPEERRPLLKLARQHHVAAVAIVLEADEHVCLDQAHAATARGVRHQVESVHRALQTLDHEGFRRVHVLAPADAEVASLIRKPLPVNRRHEPGPFDLIGDVHGCCDELEELLERLGYRAGRLVYDDEVWGSRLWSHPTGRRVLFVGDLVDRGPRVLDTLRLIRNMVRHRQARCVRGNHDDKFLRYLQGHPVHVSHGLDKSIGELEQIPEPLRTATSEAMADFLHSLTSHYVLDGGRLVVAHAGLPERLQGRSAHAVWEFALYGDTTGEVDEYGLPVRRNWAADYHGRALMVYGHTPVPEPASLNNAINIDTGCVFGGHLTALRYPERTLVSVPARAVYTPSRRPFPVNDRLR